MNKPHTELTHEFENWKQYRDYWALEATFLMQLADRNPSRRNKARAKKAAQRALSADGYMRGHQGITLKGGVEPDA